MIDFSQNIQRHPVKRVHYHGRLLFQFSTDIRFGYAWLQQGYTYSVLSHWWLGSPQFRWNNMRQFIDFLYPLGTEWTGRTSQGQPLSLYRSPGGLDWYVGWIGDCADGSQTSANWEEDLTDVKRDGSFTDSYSYSTTTSDGITNLRDDVAFSGRFPASAASTVTESFGAHLVNADDPTDQGWDCQAGVNWHARLVR